MQAETILTGTRGQGHQATSHPTRRRVGADRMLAMGILAIALVAGMVIAMIPSFAGVPVEGSAVPAPTPAPPIVVESAR